MLASDPIGRTTQTLLRNRAPDPPPQEHGAEGGESQKERPAGAFE